MPIDLVALRAQQTRGERLSVPLSHRVRGVTRNLGYAAAILRRKPELFFRLLYGTAAGRLLRRGGARFRTLTLALDYRCNYDCDHCNISLLEKPDQELLSAEDYRRLDDDMRPYGVFSYALTGGEPLYCDRLFDIIEALRPRERLILIQTNAALLDDAMARRLRDAGVDIVSVSLDKMHARHRGAGDRIDFEWYDDVLRIAGSNGLKVQFLYVADTASLESGEFEQVLNYCFARNVLLLFNPPIPLGRWRERTELLISPENSGFLRTLERQTPYARTDHKSNLKGHGCPAFKEKLYISPYGDVQGCTFLQFSIGNLKTEPLEDMLERVHQLPYFEEYVPVCPPAEDRDFIETRLRGINEASRHPIDLETYLNLPKDAGK